MKITPEMIEAGEAALDEMSDGAGCVADIYEAMAKLAKPEPSRSFSWDSIPRENRIEALRAASRIVAGQDMGILHKQQGVADTLYLAEQFEKYLEGE